MKSSSVSCTILIESSKKVGAVVSCTQAFVLISLNLLCVEPTGTLTFTRQVVNEADFPNWDVAQETLRDLYISSEGTIEKEGHGLLQMDFANR